MKKMAVRCSSVSFKGGRENNEDRVISEICKKYKRRQVVLGAADGMGGYEKGDTAAEIMIEQLDKLNKKELSLDFSKTADIVRMNIKAVNRLIYKKSTELESGQMGTTVSGVVVIGNLCLFFNVGDSRTYLVDSGGIRQMTEDHSADMEAWRNGVIKDNEIGKGYYSHAITRSIGTDPEVEVDIFPNGDFHILNEGEIIFCCTDGLWNVVTDEEIHREIIGRGSIGDSLEALASLAYAKGPNDNISMAALEYGRIPRKNLNLKQYQPISRMDGNTQQKKNVILSTLLIASIFAFLVVAAVLMVGMIKKNPANAPSFTADNSKQEINRPAGTPASPYTKYSTSVTDTGEKDYKPESQGGMIKFSIPGGKYMGRAQVRLTYEPLTSLRGDAIDSEIYYTTNGREPDRKNSKKYQYGEKIVFNRPGRYTLKVKLFSTVGKYESRVYLQEYNIVKSTSQ